MTSDLNESEDDDTASDGSEVAPDGVNDGLRTALHTGTIANRI